MSASPPSSPKPHVLVLGAGVCGLYAARVLLAAGVDVTVLEKDVVPGGLAMGRKRGANFYDLGVHMLHEHDPEIFEDMKRILGDERTEVPLDAKIKWMGEYYRYPLQFQDMVRHMSLFKLAYYGSALVWSQIRYKLFPREPRDAEEALIQLYGHPLYAFFFKEFTHRYWGIPASSLSAGFIKTKMPRLSAVDIIKKGLARLGFKEKKGMAVESALLDETLHYSRTGAESLPRRLAGYVADLGGTILLGHPVVRVGWEGNRVSSATARQADGTEVTLPCDYCLNTVPVTEFVRAFAPAPPDEVLAAAGTLRYKAIAIYGVLVRKEKCLDANYIYYRRRLFHRVGEPRNGGLAVEPPGHTVLIVEMTCDIGDPKWNGEPEAWNQIVEDLEAEHICRRDEIVKHHVLTHETGYPIFDLGFEPHFEKIRKFLDGLHDVQTVGRQGGFCYPNMHSAMRMGATAARKALAELGAGPKT